MAMTTEFGRVCKGRGGADAFDMIGARVQVPRYHRRKHLPDRVLAALLLIPGLPMIGLLVLIVRLESRGPGIFRQVRVGRRGKTFTMYKIRTMRIDAEAKSGPTWAVENDPRLTRVGRFIRAVHLDELPQLLNVLKGEMALVGPRPERPEFTGMLSSAVEGYLDRLAVRPGVTGMAQINLPPDSDLDSVRRKLVLDLAYLHEASLGLDLRILCWTAFRLFGVKRSVAMHLLRLYRDVQLPNQPVELQMVDVTQDLPHVKSHGAHSSIEDERIATSGQAHSHNGVHKRVAKTVKPR